MSNFKYLDATLEIMKSKMDELFEFMRTADEEMLKRMYDVLCCYTTIPMERNVGETEFRPLPIYHGLGQLYPLKDYEDVVPLKHMHTTTFYDKYKHRRLYQSHIELWKDVMFDEEDMRKIATINNPFKSFINLVPVEYLKMYVPDQLQEGDIDFKPLMDLLLEVKTKTAQIMHERNITVEYRCPYTTLQELMQFMADLSQKAHHRK